MRALVVSLLVIVNFIFGTAFLQYIAIFGVKPDLFIILIVAYAIMRGGTYGTAIGLGAGFLMDIMYGRTFGLNALSYMITGYLIGQLHENIFKDSVIPAILFNAAAVFLYQNIYFLVAYMSNNLDSATFSYTYTLIREILPQCLYNGILGGFLYRYLYKLDNKRFMDRRIY